LGVNDFPGVPPGPAGADQTWDFSTLPQITEHSYIFMDPSETPFQDSFPAANLAARMQDTTYFFYNLTGSTVESIGLAKDQPGFGIIEMDLALDPERIISVPFTFGNSESDTFEGTQGALGVQQYISGTKSIEADAWGTLILPNGTYMNTIRLREERTQSSVGAVYESEVHRWISPDRVFWLLEVGENLNPGGVVTYLNRWSLNPLQVGMADAPSATAGLNVLNTVVRRGDPIRIWSWAPTTGSLTFTDLNGRRISALARTTLGREGMELPTAGLASGVYVITFLRNGKAQTTRVVVQ